jgi:hypothetical protein
MENEPHILPGEAVKGIATGLIMMAVLTLVWAGIAFGGLYKTGIWLVLLVFPVLSIVFLVNAIKLFKAAKYFPKLTSEADIAEEKSMGKWFGIIFGAEGLGIFVGINIAYNLGHPDLLFPVIALCVGLHFFPLAKVFKRTIDYYIGTWATIIAILGFIFTLNKTMPVDDISAFLGIGFAIATSSYGVYMMLYGRQVIKQVPVPQGN